MRWRVLYLHSPLSLAEEEEVEEEEEDEEEEEKVYSQSGGEPILNLGPSFLVEKRNSLAWVLPTKQARFLEARIVQRDSLHTHTHLV